MPDFYIDLGAARTAVAVELDVLLRVGEMIRGSVPRSHGGRVVMITDGRVGELYAATLTESLHNAGFQTLEYRVEPGETSKSLSTAGEIYGFLAGHAVARDAIIVALGGGVVSDLAGFVAATWMRGIRFVICPTTLESDVDACIGGKTAVNIPGAKNLVGAFHQPILVAVDPACLETLEDRDIRAGLAESVKHALIRSPEFLTWHEANADGLLARDHARLEELILQNLRIKAGIVEQDAREEKGLRELLNFGHTVGHAIEECSGFALRHGECVALGMVAACRLSHMAGSLDAAIPTRVQGLLERLGLPTTLSEPIDTDRIMEAVRRDKKVRSGAVRFVLLEKVGHATIRNDIPEEQVRTAYESLLP